MCRLIELVEVAMQDKTIINHELNSIFKIPSKKEVMAVPSKKVKEDKAVKSAGKEDDHEKDEL